MQNILSSIMAARGRQLKQSVNIFHILMLYRRLPINARTTIRFSYVDIPSTLTFIIKSVYAVGTSTLMIASQKKKVLGILYLISEQEANRLDTLLPPIHIISQEKVVGCGWESAVFEHSKKVTVLAMDVA